MKKRTSFGWILAASLLLILQYYLAFFYFKLPGIKLIQYLGWILWLISLYLGLAPMWILRKKGMVEPGKPYTETTRLVDSGLYAIIRHPQYTAGIFFSLALCLLAQHWWIVIIGVICMAFIYIDIQNADQEGLEKFGTCDGCPGGNVEYTGEEMVKNGAQVIHLATGLIVGYPPCPYIHTFKEFLERRNGVKVVIGTHPIPEKYLKMHTELGTWKDPSWEPLLAATMTDEATRKAYE